MSAFSLGFSRINLAVNRRIILTYEIYFVNPYLCTCLFPVLFPFPLPPALPRSSNNLLFSRVPLYREQFCAKRVL